MSNRDILIIFLKPLIEGKVKTRLAKNIGDSQALLVYKKLVSHTIEEAGKLPKEMKVLLCYSEKPGISSLFPGDHDFIVQEGATLGDRMAFAFSWADDNGYGRKIIIGSDCADLNVTHLKEAFFQLKGRDIVIGPAKDGGYYLIGMTAPHSFLFGDIRWSTDTVYETTIKKINFHRLSFAALEILSDIDELEDLEKAPLFLK